MPIMAGKSVNSHCFKNVKYYANKHGWKQPLYGVFKVTGCFIWCARYKHFVVCGQLCHSTARYIISMVHTICALCTKLYKHDAFHKDWICVYVCWEICHLQLYTSVDAVSATQWWVVWWSCGLQQHSTDFAKACVDYETLKSFFYAHSIAGCDEHELWIGTICLKCKVLK